jgi:hypothetical protein
MNKEIDKRVSEIFDMDKRNQLDHAIYIAQKLSLPQAVVYKSITRIVLAIRIAEKNAKERAKDNGKD